MYLGILFGLLVLIATSYGFFNFGRIGENGGMSYVHMAVITTMLIVMLLAISIYIFRNHKIKSISRWPYTQGRILSVSLADSIMGPRVKIKYQYHVNDIHFENNNFDYFSDEAPLGQVFMMPGMREISRIEDLRGKMVRVYFKSDSPYESYISCSLNQNPLIVLLPSIIIIPACLFLLARIANVF